jgi:hypothetical protein
MHALYHIREKFTFMPEKLKINPNFSELFSSHAESGGITYM